MHNICKFNPLKVKKKRQKEKKKGFLSSVRRKGQSISFVKKNPKNELI